MSRFSSENRNIGRRQQCNAACATNVCALVESNAAKNLISRCLVFKNKRQSEAQEESSRKEAESYFSAYVRGRGGRGSGLGGAGVRGVRRGVGGI